MCSRSLRGVSEGRQSNLKYRLPRPRKPSGSRNDREKGFMSKDKKINLKNLIVGILNECGEIPKVKLAKLILFAELEHFHKTGESITGLYFVRLRKGPVIAFFDEVLESGEGVDWTKKTSQIPIKEEGIQKVQYSYHAKRKQTLSKEVDRTIKNTCAKYGKMSGTKLSGESHNFPAWKYAEPNEPIYLAELAVKDEKEYFNLVDAVEEIDESNDAIIPEKISQALPRR